LFDINVKDERFDIDKDVHEGTFMAVEDISTTLAANEQRIHSMPPDN